MFSRLKAALFGGERPKKTTRSKKTAAAAAAGLVGVFGIISISGTQVERPGVVVEDPPPPVADYDDTSVPQAADFPTPTSVGPAVEPTILYSGDCNWDASDSGMVIDSRIIDCDNSEGGLIIDSDATGIVVTNSIIRGQVSIQGSWEELDEYPRAKTITIEDSKIIQTIEDSTQARAIMGSHYTVRRSYLQAQQSGLNAHSNVIAENNYITTDGTGTHQSGMRVLKNSAIHGNTIQCKPYAAGYNDSGCSAHGVFYRERLDGTNEPLVNVIINRNYFKRGVDNATSSDGGPYIAVRFIDCANWTDCLGNEFSYNLFSYGESTDAEEFPFYGDNVWANNYWPDGQLALSGQSR